MKFKGRAVIAFVALLQKGLVAIASDGSDEDEQMVPMKEDH